MSKIRETMDFPNYNRIFRGGKMKKKKKKDKRTQLKRELDRLIQEIYVRTKIILDKV